MKSANRPLPVPETPADPPRRLVLVADSSVPERRLLARLLRRGGYDVAEAGDGAEALALCRELSPELVLSDWDMPQLSGLEFCRAFRQLQRETHGYFVILTKSVNAADITAALDAGADDFLPKPIVPLKLLARLAAGERILRIEEELRSSNRQLRDALAKLSETQAVIEHDLREARKLQQGLVRERSGRFGQAEISLLLRPAGHVGGDLVGFFPIGDDRIGLYALDVSGHGVTAALLTAQLSVHLSGSSDQNVALRGAQSGQDTAGPAALAHFFNNMMLEEMSTDSYFTMIYGELNYRTGQLRMVQAGHPHPVLQRSDGTIEQLGRGGMPIGVIEEPIFDEIDVTLHPGDRLLIASDGITEAQTPNGRQLGNEGLEAVMRTNAFLHGHSFLESMAWSVSEYCRGERQDDMSAVLLEFRGESLVIRLD